MTSIAALVAAGHMYLFQWQDGPPKALFLLPSEGENACGVGPVNFGPADSSWSAGSAGTQASCEFRQVVNPGAMMSVWVDAPQARPGVPLEVAWTLTGGKAKGKGRSETMKPQPVSVGALKASAAGLRASATKVKNDVRVEVKNTGSGPILLGDAVAARTPPRDPCLGNGPEALVQPGETLVDIRPGLLSPSMNVYAAAFTGPKQCRWVEIARK